MNDITKSGDLPENGEYLKARELNRRIVTAAQLAQQSLYEMCAGFKEMRDTKLYRQLGYEDFGDYCEKETTISRQQVYRYISIYENLPEELVKAPRQIGTEKLYLLSTLSEAERVEITEKNDLEEISSRELKEKIAEIKKLREKCEQLTFELTEKENTADEKSSELTAALKEIGRLESELEMEKKTKVLTAAEISPEELERVRAEARKEAEQEAAEAVDKAKEAAKEAKKQRDAADASAKDLLAENMKLSNKLAAAEKEKDELKKAAAKREASASKPLPSTEKERVKVHLQIVIDNFSAAAGIAANTENEAERAALKKGLVRAAEQISAAAERV